VTVPPTGRTATRGRSPWRHDTAAAITSVEPMTIVKPQPDPDRIAALLHFPRRMSSAGPPV
jgi:hypothetical protein